MCVRVERPKEISGLTFVEIIPFEQERRGVIKCGFGAASEAKDALFEINHTHTVYSARQSPHLIC